MPVIKLNTAINSNIEICFDLSTSIDFHTKTTAKTKEKAIAGRTEGLIKLNETVTWEATHYGVRQRLTSKITAYNRPYHFRDEMVKGIFKSIKHDHYFKQDGDKVIMTDVFEFQSPFGILGKIFNKLILTNYLKKFLLERNQIIKKYAETEQWKEILNERVYTV